MINQTCPRNIYIKKDSKMPGLNPTGSQSPLPIFLFCSCCRLKQVHKGLGAEKEMRNIHYFKCAIYLGLWIRNHTGYMQKQGKGEKTASQLICQAKLRSSGGRKGANFLTTSCFIYTKISPDSSQISNYVPKLLYLRGDTVNLWRQQWEIHKRDDLPNRIRCPPPPFRQFPNS